MGWKSKIPPSKAKVMERSGIEKVARSNRVSPTSSAIGRPPVKVQVDGVLFSAILVCNIWMARASGVQ